MCGAPERLTAFGMRTFLVLLQQLKTVTWYKQGQDQDQI
jgi:hypothetical protein